MLATQWSRLVVLVVAGAISYAGLWSIARTIALKLKARRRFNRIFRIVNLIVQIYLGLLLIGFLWAKPWQDTKHWKNIRSLEAQKASEPKPDFKESIEELEKALTGHATYSDASKPTWVSQELLSKLNTSDTLIGVSISGGGSRSAYFAAAVLEQLSKISMPGQTGPGRSLVNHIDLLSTVSGGSIAGAYFAANLPTDTHATDGELAQFFSRFKAAMAMNFQDRMLLRIAMPTNTIAFLGGDQSGAEIFADVLDRDLFHEQEFGTLLKRERVDRTPILLINATDLQHFNAFVFSPEKEWMKILVPSQRPDNELGGSSTERSTASYPRGKEIEPFGSFWGDLSNFKIADAVAASAAFPVALSAIRLHERANGSNPTTYLGDAGDVDNSGLLSLYAHLFQRSMFCAAAGKLKRVVIIAIDASTEGQQYTSATAVIGGIYDIGQYQMQQFVLPEMLRRLSIQDLADILEKPEWEKFRVPRPIALSYMRCVPWGIPLVATKLKLSNADRVQIDNAAIGCVAMKTNLIKGSVDGSLRQPSEYTGVLAPSDSNAWKTLVHIAITEKKWMESMKRFISIEEIRKDRKLWHALGDDIQPETTGFVFQTQSVANSFRLSATPLRYRAPGRISLFLDIPRELMDLDYDMFCNAIVGRFRGGDLRGAEATSASVEFLPYGFSSNDMCR